MLIRGNSNSMSPVVRGGGGRAGVDFAQERAVQGQDVGEGGRVGIDGLGHADERFAGLFRVGEPAAADHEQAGAA